MLIRTDHGYIQRRCASASGARPVHLQMLLGKLVLQMTAAYAMESCECSRLTQALQAHLATVSECFWIGEHCQRGHI